MSLPALRPGFKEPKRFEEVDVPQEFDDSGVREEQYQSPVWARAGEQVYGVYVGEKRLKIESVEDGKRVKQERTLYLIREDSGQTIAVWGTTTLADQMSLKMPQAGDRIIIVYLGLGVKKGVNNAPHLFRVGVKRRGAANG